MLGVGVMVYAFAGQTLSDQAESMFGYTPSEKDKERLKNALPTIRTIDKDGP